MNDLTIRPTAVAIAGAIAGAATILGIGLVGRTAPDDSTPSFAAYEAAIGDIMTCLEGEGLQVIGPFPTPDGRQLLYDIELTADDPMSDDAADAADEAIALCRRSTAGDIEYRYLRDLGVLGPNA